MKRLPCLLFCMSMIVAYSLFSVLAFAAETDRETALALARAGKPEAYEALQVLVQAQPSLHNDNDVLLWLARTASQAGKYEQAITPYTALSERFPNDAPLLLEYAKTLVMLEREQEARPLVERARLLEKISPEQAEQTFQSFVQEKAINARLLLAQNAAASGQHDQAYSAYMQLWREFPQHPLVLLGLGRAAHASQRWPHALLAYERLVESFPADAQLRLEYAQILVALEQSEAAATQINVLRQLEPTFTEKQATDLLAALEKNRSTLLVNGHVGTGVIHDTNVNAGPGSSNITTPLGQLILDPSNAARKSMGIFTTAGIDLSWRANPDAKLWMVGDAMAYQKWYSSARDKDTLFSRAAMGLRFANERVFVDARFKVENVIEDKLAKVNVVGGELSFSVLVHPNMALLTRAAMERRDYCHGDAQSGSYYWVGEYVRFFWGAGHNLTLGARWLGSSTREEQYASIGKELSAQLGINLSPELSLNFLATYKKEDYDGPAIIRFIDPRNRADEQQRYGAFLNWAVSPEWSVDFGYQYTKNQSNSGLYRYKQHYVSWGVTWKF